MSEIDSLNESKHKQLGTYYVRAVLLVAFVYLISLALPAMPSPVVAVLWAVFTVVSMLGILYQASIRKANKQQQFIAGGIAAWFNNGRLFRLIASFAASAVLMASLLLESPKWDIAEWALIIAAVVFYPLVEYIVYLRVCREYEEIFQKAGEIRWTSIFVGILLCVGYAACSWFTLGVTQGQANITVFDALIATPQPFANATSALLQDAGTGTWIVDGIVSFGITQLSQMPWPVCIAIRAGLCAGAFFGMANLLGVCSLQRSELRKAFIPTDAIKNRDAQASVRKRYIICVVFLSAVWADGKTEQAMQTGGGTALQSLARQLAGKSVYVIDGKYYDQAKIDSLTSSLDIDQANFHAKALSLERSVDTVYGTDASKGKLEENVDSFLDWYYNIATDNSVREGISANNVQQSLEDQFYERVAASEDEQITQEVKGYLQAASDLEAKIDDGYREAEVHGEQYENLPDWFVEAKENTDALRVKSYRQQVENALNAARNSGLTSAFAEGSSLLRYQLENKVYGQDPFEAWAKTTKKVIDGDIPSNISGRIDSVLQGKRSEYRSAVVSQIIECRTEAESLVAENIALG